MTCRRRSTAAGAMRSFWARDTFGGFTATVAFVSRTVFSSGSAMSLPRDRRVVVRAVVRLVCLAIHASDVLSSISQNPPRIVNAKCGGGSALVDHFEPLVRRLSLRLFANRDNGLCVRSFRPGDDGRATAH